MTMKKLILLFSVVLITTSLMAQVSQPVNFTAILSNIFNLNVVSGQNQVATFATASDYNNGVFEGAGIATGFTDVTMEATTDWSLDITAPDFVGGSGAEVIPITNLAVWVDETPVTPIHTIGVEVSCTAIDPATSLGLTTGIQTLLDVGPSVDGNAGNALENAFTLHWRMGTTDNVSQNPETMFTQMSNGDFGPGTYTTIVTLTMNPE
jgi:hypothetical protein